MRGRSAASGTFAGLLVGTTVFGQVGHKRVHRIELSSITDRATALLSGDQPGRQQLLQMEGKGGARKGEGLGYVARKLPATARLDQQTEDRKSGGVAQGSQSVGCVFMFHDSRIVESN